MKKVWISFIAVSFCALVAGSAWAGDNSEQCIMCHQDAKEDAIAAHQDCMACHADGADAHLEDFRTHPEPVTDETCATCHKPTDEFLEISAHQMEMECSACHKIHEG